MGKRMIDYQVEGNKISTIDGYKVGGGDKKLKITYTPEYLDLQKFQAGATVEAGKVFLTQPQYVHENELPMQLGTVAVGSFGTAICAWSVFRDSATNKQYGALTCITSGKLESGIVPRMLVYKITVDEVSDESAA